LRKTGEIKFAIYRDAQKNYGIKDSLFFGSGDDVCVAFFGHGVGISVVFVPTFGTGYSKKLRNRRFLVFWYLHEAASVPA
jgi:hypothetical protein